MSKTTIRAKRKQVPGQLSLFQRAADALGKSNPLNKLAIASVLTQSYGVDATRQHQVEGHPQLTGSQPSLFDSCEPNECKGELKMEETTKRKTYPQRWREYNLAQTREKAHFEVLLYDLCRGVDTPVQTMGRPRHDLGDIIFCLATQDSPGDGWRLICTRYKGGASSRRLHTLTRCTSTKRPR